MYRLPMVGGVPDLPWWVCTGLPWWVCTSGWCVPQGREEGGRWVWWVPSHTPRVGREYIQPFMQEHSFHSRVHPASCCCSRRHHCTDGCVGEGPWALFGRNPWVESLSVPPGLRSVSLPMGFSSGLLRSSRGECAEIGCDKGLSLLYYLRLGSCAQGPPSFWLFRVEDYAQRGYLSYVPDSQLLLH